MARRLTCLGLILSFLANAPLARGESVTLTTYYPAPSGVYTNMITTANTFLARDGGNVGIGTANPQYKLDVLGTINATALNVPTLTGISNLSVTGNISAGGTLTSNGNSTVLGHLGVGGAANASYSIYATGPGIYSTAGSGAIGVQGASSNNYAGYFVASAYHGLYAQSGGAYWAGYFTSPSGYGVYGNGATYGLYGNASTYGVYGNGVSYGVYGNGTSYGVFGNGSATAGGVGVYGVGASNNWSAEFVGAYGVYGSGTAGEGVYGVSSGNWAGYFTSSGYHGLAGVAANGSYIAVDGYNNNGYYGYLGYSSYSIYGNGYLYGAGGYVGSDRRLKDDILPIDDPLAMIEKLRPVSYRWKPGTDQRHAHGDQRDFGFIAQEVEKILPEIVRDVPTMKNPVSESETMSLNEQLGSIKAIDYERVVPFVTGAVQQLHRQNESLQKENSQLKLRVDELEQRLNRLEGRAPLD